MKAYGLFPCPIYNYLYFYDFLMISFSKNSRTIRTQAGDDICKYPICSWVLDSLSIKQCDWDFVGIFFIGTCLRFLHIFFQNLNSNLVPSQSKYCSRRPYGILGDYVYRWNLVRSISNSNHVKLNPIQWISLKFIMFEKFIVNHLFEQF